MVTASSPLARIGRLVHDPVGVLKRRFQALRSSPGGPDLSPLVRFSDQARLNGVEGLYLFLSFDCDTDLDIEASRRMHDFLGGLGIRMTMAVPGTQLLNGAEVYAGLGADGVEFMNHGFLPHAAWQDDSFISTTFYHEMADEAVAADIRKGHETVASVIGLPPSGFRAPHFGLYQEPRQLELVHRTARELGYLYCSTTIPSFGHAHGPVVDAGGIVELPTFGSVRAPTTILDSWTYLTDRRDYVLDGLYADLMIETVDTMLDRGMSGILSWYADPSHVIGQEPFERAMTHIARRGMRSLSGREAAAMGASATAATVG